MLNSSFKRDFSIDFASEFFGSSYTYVYYLSRPEFRLEIDLTFVFKQSNFAELYKSGFEFYILEWLIFYLY